MITTVTLNPAIDKTIILDEVRLGEVHRILEVVSTVGGKGINVSKVLRLFDVDNITTGILGTNNKEMFYKYLDKQNMTYDFVETCGTTRTNIKMIEKNHQRTTDLNEKGIVLKPGDIDIFIDKIQSISRQSDYVVLCGSVPQGVSDDVYAEIIVKIKNGAKVALDTSGKSLKRGIKAGAHIIKPNKGELEDAFGQKFLSNEGCIDFCKTLISKYALETVLLTFGADGAALINEDTVIMSKPIRVEVKNTVGAGDSFLGGYLVGKARKLDDKQALKIAVACGTVAVRQKGTDVFSKQEFDSMIKRVIIT